MTLGGIVGLGTNYLALQMIFRPLEPTKYFGFTFQGMFPRRQAEISTDYGRITAREILTLANLLRILAEGEAGTRRARLVLAKVSERVDAARPSVEVLAQLPVSDEQLDIAGLVETKLNALSKLEFERLLRGIFEQDEWILIAAG